MNNIPQFPKFKKFSHSDIPIIKVFTNNFPVYSEFSMVNLYGWDFDNNNEYSILNGNLILHIKDEYNDKPIYTFFGQNEIRKTLSQLLSFTKTLNLVPAINFKDENFLELLEKYNILIDPNNFDYVYSLNEIVELKGREYKEKRKYINRFQRENDHFEIKELRLEDQIVQQEIIKLTEVWQTKRELKCKLNKFVISEKGVIKKILTDLDPYTLIGIGAFNKNTNSLACYQIYEICNKEWAIGHFTKDNLEYKFINDFTFYFAAKIFKNKGLKYLNTEQDLGLKGLRGFKNSWNPLLLLKKFMINYR